jgi:hypothetical protein
MCRVSCRHGTVWTVNSAKYTELGKGVGTDKKSFNYISRRCKH